MQHNGKNRGIEIIDLGTDVKAEDFIEAAIKYDCDIIGMSALLTTSMKEMEKVIRAAEAVIRAVTMRSLQAPSLLQSLRAELSQLQLMEIA